MNEFIKPFQKETFMITAIREENITELINKVSLPVYKAFLAIKKYYAQLIYSINKKWKDYQPKGTKINLLKDSNKLYITPELLVNFGGSCECSKTKDTNSKARSLMKKLADKGVVYKIDIDYYIVNPLYIYIGKTIDDCWYEWCQLTGEDYDETVWNATRKKKDYSTGEVGLDISRAQLEKAKELNVPVSGHPETVEELEEQIQETTEDIIERLKNDQRNIVWYNQNIIRTYGIDIAKQVIKPEHFAIAVNNLKVEINGEKVYLDKEGQPLPW